jgi:hypothetical protein
MAESLRSSHHGKEPVDILPEALHLLIEGLLGVHDLPEGLDGGCVNLKLCLRRNSLAGLIEAG